MDSEYDVLVVGARIAGATIAAVLGQAGHRVLLIDRATLPSPTPSTHFFRGAHLVRILRRLDLLQDVLDRGAPPLTREFHYSGGGAIPSTSPPQEGGDVGYSLSVRRSTLDTLLFTKAAGYPSVTTSLRTRLHAVHTDDEKVLGATVVLPTGESQDVRARVIVGADGQHSVIARAVQSVTETQAHGARGMFYQYVQGYGSPDGSPLNAAEFSLLDDEIAYVFPSDQGVTCAAMSVGMETFNWMRESTHDRFYERLNCHAGVASRVTAAQPVSPVMVSYPADNFMRVPAGPGWALVGDAGVHQDPWSGQGMDCAGIHAEMLAEELMGFLAGQDDGERWQERYHRRRNAHVTPIYEFTVGMSRDLRPLSQSVSD